MRLRTACQGLLVATVILSGTLRADDTEIARELSQALETAKSTGQLRGFRMGVKVNDGTVWMKGEVASDDQRQLALNAARKIAGVRLVVNEISVTSGQSNTASVRGTDDGEPAPIAPMPSMLAAAAEPADPFAAYARPTTTPLPVTEVAVSPVSAAREAGGVQRPHAARAAKLTAAPAVPVRRNRRVAYESQANSCPPGACGMGSGGRPAGSGDYMGVDGSYEVNGGHYASGGGYAAGDGHGYATAAPVPMNGNMVGMGMAGGVAYDHPQMPAHAWPSYASYPNYAAVSYPQQYSPMAWPYIGPFYPYPQVPLGWRKVTLEWDDGWWMLDFSAK